MCITYILKAITFLKHAIFITCEHIYTHHCFDRNNRDITVTTICHLIDYREYEAWSNQNQYANRSLVVNDGAVFARNDHLLIVPNRFRTQPLCSSNWKIRDALYAHHQHPNPAYQGPTLSELLGQYVQVVPVGIQWGLVCVMRWRYNCARWFMAGYNENILLDGGKVFIWGN
jgi:hypothetical protein